MFAEKGPDAVQTQHKAWEGFLAPTPLSAIADKKFSPTSFCRVGRDKHVHSEDSKLLLMMDIELDVQSLKEYQLCPKDGKVSVVEFMECPILRQPQST